MELIKKQGKLNFTATDVENNLYFLATSVMEKVSDPTKVNSAISAYNALIKLEALKLKAHSYSQTKAFRRKTIK